MGATQQKASPSGEVSGGGVIVRHVAQDLWVQNLTMIRQTFELCYAIRPLATPAKATQTLHHLLKTFSPTPHLVAKGHKASSCCRDCQFLKPAVVARRVEGVSRSVAFSQISVVASRLRRYVFVRNIMSALANSIFSALHIFHCSLRGELQTKHRTF